MRKVVNGYGLTETTICTTLELCHKDKPLTIGQPILGCEVQLRPLHEEIEDRSTNQNTLNSQTQWLQKYNEPGALYVAGPCVARGYWQRRELTQTSFKIVEKAGYSKTFYRSGDVGFIHPQVCNIVLTGRIDRQVKIRGQRLELGELEQKIRRLVEIVKDVRVLAYDQQEQRTLRDGKKIVEKSKVLVVFIVPHDNNLVITDSQKPTAESLEILRQIRENLRAQSAQFLLPALNHMRFIKSLPYKGNDKKSYDDKAIQETFPVLPCIQLPSLPWERIIEDLKLDEEQEHDFQQICILYAESLGLSFEQLSFEAEYESLGGDSLKVKWLFERIKAARSNGRLKSNTATQGLVSVTITDFAKDPTCLGLWHSIEMQQLQAGKIQEEFQIQLQQMPKLSSARLMGEALGFYKQESRFEINHKISLPVFMVPSLLGDTKIDYAGSELERLPFILTELNLPAESLIANTIDDYFKHLTKLYVERIQQHQASGPYFIMGWSSGGLIAVMIANTLRQMGEIAFAINLDGHHPHTIAQFNTKQYAELLSQVGEKIRDGICVILSLNQDTHFELPTLEMLSHCSNKNEQIQLMLKVIRNSLETLRNICDQPIEEDIWQRAKKILLNVECILTAELEPLEITMDARDHLLIAMTSENLWGKNLGWMTQTDKIYFLKNCNHFSLLYHEDLISLLKNIICELIDQIKTPYYQGLSCLLQERWEEAVAYYDEAIMHNTKDADAYYRRGVAKARLNFYEKAIEDFDEAINYGYTEAQIFSNRGMGKVCLGLLQEALKDYDEAVERITFMTTYAAIIYRHRGEVKARLDLYPEALKDYDEAIKRDPISPDGYYSRGQIKNRLGLYEEALRDFNLAILKGEKNGDVFAYRACAKEQLGLNQAALKDFDEALKHEFDAKANKAISYKKRGVLKANLDLYEEAMKDYEEAIRHDFDDIPEIKHCLGICKYNLGLYQEALQYYDEAIRGNPDEARFYVNRAYAKERLGLFEDSIKDHNEAINKGTKDKDAYHFKEQTKTRLSSYQKALRDFEEANQDRNYAKAYYNLGLAKAHLGLKREALQNYDLAISHGLAEAEVYYKRGLIKADLGLAEEAIEDYQNAIRRNPDNADIYVGLGIAKAELHSYQEAIKDYEEAIRLGLNTAQVYYSRGFAKHNLRMEDEAIKDYDEAISRDPKIADLYSNRGIMKLNLGLYHEALKDINEAFKLGLKTADLYRSRAEAKFGTQLYSESLEDFNEAIRRGIEDAKIYINRGTCKAFLYLHQQAVNDFDEAIRKGFDSGNVFFMRGLAQIALKNFQDAQNDFDEALKHNFEAEYFYYRGFVKDKLGLFQEALEDIDEAIKGGYDKEEALQCRYRIEANLKLYHEEKKGFGDLFSPELENEAAYYNRGLTKAKLNLDRVALKDFDEAIARGLENAKIYFDRGKSKAFLKSYQEALADFDEAINQGYEDPEVYYYRGMVKSNLNLDSAAIEDHNLAIRHGFDGAKVYYTRGATKFNLALYDEADKDFDEAIKRGYNNSETYNARGRAKMFLQQHDAAIKDFDEALKLEPAAARIYQQRGTSKLVLKQRSEAIKDFDRAIELQPSNGMNYLSRGMARNLSGFFQEAIADFDVVIAFNAQDGNAYYERGKAKAALELFAEAVEDFDLVIAFNTEDGSAYYERGKAKAELKLFTAAIEDFNKALDCVSAPAQVYYQRGLAKSGLELYREAIADFDLALWKGYKDDDIYYSRGAAKTYIDLDYGAIEDLNRAIEEDDTNTDAYFFRGKAKYNLDLYIEAIQDFDIVLAQETDIGKRATVYRRRADANADLKDFAQALRDYDESIKLDPESAASYFYRARVKMGLELYREAIRDFNKSIQIDPDDDDAYFNRGIAKLLDQHRLSKYYIDDVFNDLTKKLREKQLAPDDFDLPMLKKSLKNLRKMVQFYPTCKGFWIQGKIKRLLGQFKHAICDFERMKKLATVTKYRLLALEEIAITYETQKKNKKYTPRFLTLYPEYKTGTKRRNESASTEQGEKLLTGYEQFGLLKKISNYQEQKLPRTEAQDKTTLILSDGRILKILEVQEAEGDGNCGFRAVLGETYLRKETDLLTRKGIIELFKTHLNQPIISALLANDLIAKYHEWIAGIWIMEKDVQFPQILKNAFTRLKEELQKNDSPRHLAQVNSQFRDFCVAQEVIEHYLNTYLSYDTIWPHYQGSLAAFAHILNIKIVCLQVQPEGNLIEVPDEFEATPMRYQEEVFLILNKERTHFDRLKVEVMEPSVAFCL